MSPALFAGVNPRMFCLASRASLVAVLSGLLTSEVLSTLLRPTSVLVKLTSPILPATEVTGAGAAEVMYPAGFDAGYGANPRTVVMSVESTAAEPVTRPLALTVTLWKPRFIGDKFTSAKVTLMVSVPAPSRSPISVMV